MRSNNKYLTMGSNDVNDKRSPMMRMIRLDRPVIVGLNDGGS
jgi:hypothetical protein